NRVIGSIHSIVGDWCYSVASVDDIVAAAATDGIIPGAAIQIIAPGTAVDGVVTVEADDEIVEVVRPLRQIEVIRSAVPKVVEISDVDGLSFRIGNVISHRTGSKECIVTDLPIAETPVHLLKYLVLYPYRLSQVIKIRVVVGSRSAEERLFGARVYQVR